VFGGAAGGALGGVAGGALGGAISGALESKGSGLMTIFKTINAAKGGLGGALLAELTSVALKNMIDVCSEDGCAK